MTQPPAEPEHVQLQLGLYVLGALSSIEAGVVDRHLARCAECRAEYAELSEVLTLLSLLSTEDVRSIGNELAPRSGAAARPPATPAGASSPAPHRPATRPAAARPEAAGPRPSAGRRRMRRFRLIVAAVGLALVFAVTIGLLLLPGSPTEMTLTGSDTNTATGATMSVAVVGADQPVHVTASMTGLSPGVPYRLNAVDSRSTVISVTQWVAENKPYTYSGIVAVPANDLAFFTVTQLDGRAVITVKVARSG
jgi:anti-sigma factor RsiW